jgi:myo-inositol-1(or 4)-monophosphatase
MRRSPETEFAVRLVREVGEIVRGMERPERAETKVSHADLRTSTDVAVEQFVIRRIREAYPDHHVIGEESGGEVVEPGRPVWFVDPIDGTTNYFRGFPMFGCNIALCVGKEVKVGVTLDIMNDVAYWAEAGRGAWADGKRLHVSGVEELSRAVLATGFPYDKAENLDNNLAEFGAILPRTRAVRRIGCAGLDLAWLAAGRFDAYWEKNLGPWDCASGALLVREAGGEVTTYDGRPWTPLEPTILASNGHLHRELRQLISEARCSLT